MRRIWVFAALAIIISCGGNNDVPQGSGLIEATEVTLSAETGGQIRAFYIDEGQVVLVGDTLALIDTVSVALRLSQAEAAFQAATAREKASLISIKQGSNNLNLAQKEYERIAALIKSGSANQQQYDQALTARDQAQLAYEQAEITLNTSRAELTNARAQAGLLRQQFDYCFPVSPINGVIVEKYLEAGELISVSKPLVRIAKLDTVWVKIYLPPSDLTRIRLGSQASVDPEDGHSAPLTGTISWLSSEAEFTPKNVQTRDARAGLLYAVKVTVPNPDGILKIGMPVAVEVK